MSHFDIDSIIARMRNNPKLVSPVEVSRVLVAMFDRMDALTQEATKPTPRKKKGGSDEG